jgi:inner membrane protein
VANSLAGEQTLVGPLIHKGCTEEWETVKDKERQTLRREFTLVALPTVLDVQGGSQLEPRARGLHATQVFNLKTRITAEWPHLQSLQAVAQHANSRLNCGQAMVMLSVSDARGIRHATLKLDEQSLPLKSGTFFGPYPRGVHAALPANTEQAGPLKLTLDLELMGTEKIALVPLGSDTQVTLHSNWPHPSFGGQFLPAERQVSDAGFQARWRVSALASSAQQDMVKLASQCQGSGCPVPTDRVMSLETLDVRFIDPSNTYALSERATKYGLLFIGLTFLAVGLFEFMKSLRVHPVQYLLVGAAITIFFLLLVSLSEHMPFECAYAAAAAACVLLLMFYASYILHSVWRGLPLGLGIAVLYGLLFVLLQMEQAALVIGAMALFCVLACIMVLTRRIDWYARLASSLSASQKAASPAGHGQP